jgi:hypothetical protein
MLERTKWGRRSSRRLDRSSRRTRPPTLDDASDEQEGLMARIPLVQYDDASPDLRDLYDRIAAARGSVLNVYKGVANHPAALRELFELTMASYRSGSLEPRHQELAYLYNSTLNQCHY